MRQLERRALFKFIVQAPLLGTLKAIGLTCGAAAPSVRGPCAGARGPPKGGCFPPSRRLARVGHHATAIAPPRPWRPVAARVQLFPFSRLREQITGQPLYPSSRPHRPPGPRKTSRGWPVRVPRNRGPHPGPLGEGLGGGEAPGRGGDVARPKAADRQWPRRYAISPAVVACEGGRDKLGRGRPLDTPPPQIGRGRAPPEAGRALLQNTAARFLGSARENEWGLVLDREWGTLTVLLRWWSTAV